MTVSRLLSYAIIIVSFLIILSACKETSTDESANSSDMTSPPSTPPYPEGDAQKSALQMHTNLPPSPDSVLLLKQGY